MASPWAITEEEAAARDALVLAEVRDAIVRFGLTGNVPAAVFFHRLRHFRNDAVLDAVGRALKRQQGAKQ